MSTTRTKPRDGPVRAQHGAPVPRGDREAGYVRLTERPQRLPQAQAVLELQRLEVDRRHAVDQWSQQEHEQLHTHTHTHDRASRSE